MTGYARLRRALDLVYDAGGIVAGVFMVAILGIILAQMVTRWMGVPFPGATDYAGYCMAAASFFALAAALRRGAHIRVSLVLQRFTGRARRVAELWCFGVGTLLAAYFAWYAVHGVQLSLLINDVSQGQDATPLWIPQLSMAIGTVLLAIALLDHFVRILLGVPVRLTDEAAPERHTE